MGKKETKSIEKLRTEVQALSEAVWALKKHVRVEVAAQSAANGSRGQKSRALTRLEARSEADGSRGLVSCYGTFRLPGPDGDRAVRWQMEHASAETLVPDDLDAAATRLAAIGHRQRLAIILALLWQPASVNDLVRDLELGTSGAAYHHLNVLQKAGLVAQQERGIFEIAREQVGCVVGILAALATTPTVEAPAPCQATDSETPIEA